MTGNLKVKNSLSRWSIERKIPYLTQENSFLDQIMQAFAREFINIWEPYNWGFLVQCQFMMLLFKLGEKLCSSDIEDVMTLKTKIVAELKESFDSCDNYPPRLSFNPFTEEYRRISYDFDVCIAKAMQIFCVVFGVFVRVGK